MSRKLICMLVLVALASSSASSETGRDETEILATIDAMFGALAARDREAMLDQVISSGRVTSVASMESGAATIWSVAWQDYMSSLPDDDTVYEEQLIDHSILIDGDIAAVWGNYLFHIDGELAHCGVDHFDMIRAENRWRILNLTWSERSEGCVEP